MKQKMYIVRKYVMAESAAQAINKSRNVPVHDVFVDDDWRKNNTDRLADTVGFQTVDNSSLQ